MILQKQKEAEILVQGEVQDTIGMSLDLDSAQMLMQMLSKNLYSDDIGSTIRETASNALDSHRRANVSDPIIVSFKTNQSYNYEFSVEDFGTGLDDEDVENIISKYGKSTKRQSVNELGMWGLGFKSPLAYSSSFYFICRKNGVERKYMMYEGEDTNSIDLLYEVPTTEKNGVKIIVPVKSSDRFTFTDKIKEQLAYFENVYFDCEGVDNDFIIHRSELFQFSELSQDESLHICLDNVYYPIDFSKLGIDRIMFPIGIRFSLTDGIFPTPNREAIRYTQETKAAIIARISELANFFVEKYNKELEIGDDISSVVNFLENKNRHIHLLPNQKLKINDLEKFSTIKPKVPELKDVSVLKFSELYIHKKAEMFDRFFSTQFYLTSGGTFNKVKYANWSVNLQNLCNGKIRIYIYKDKISGIKKEYLKSFEKNVYFMKKPKPMVLGNPLNYDTQTYYHFLNLKTIPRNQWRQAIQEFQKVQEMFYEMCINYDELVVPQDFIDNLKKTKPSLVKSGKRASKTRQEITCKQAYSLQRWNQGRNCKFESTIYTLSDVPKKNQFIIYDLHENFEKLDALFFFLERHNVKLITVNEKDKKIIDELNFHNMISYDEFMKGNNKLFKRIVTSFLINREVLTNYYQVVSKVNEIGFVSKELELEIVELRNYCKTHNFLQVNNDGGKSNSLKLMNEMIEFAEKEQKFDLSIHHLFLKFNRLMEKLYFLKTFCSRMGYWDKKDDQNKMLIDLFKHNKHKANLNLYNVKQ
jgi:hypothetical protein